MSTKPKLLLSAAVLVAVLGISFWLWWNAPVRAATRALLAIADTLQITGDESPLSRRGKAARLKRAISDPVDLKFREAGRTGAWSAESLQARYAAAALSAKSATIELENVEAEETPDGDVTITALFKARYVGGGSAPRDIERPCRWLMKKQDGDWVISSFRETE